MQADIAARIISRLVEDYGLKQAPNGVYNKGVCPECNKKELFVFAANPWVVKCGRENNCAHEIHTKERYPDAFQSFNERYQASPTNPNATADAYMQHGRGFDISRIKGWYVQEKYWNPTALGSNGKSNGNGTATVRFYICKETNIWMERFVEAMTLVDKDNGEKTLRKQKFGPVSYKGHAWQPPGLEIDDGDTIFLTEACIDSISQNLNGFKSVATLTCHNYPDKFLENHKDKDITWVWALDNDKAGKKATKKHVKRMRQEGYTVAAAQVPGKDKRDWNDLHKAGRLTEPGMVEYRYHGDLLLAPSYRAKAWLMHRHTKQNRFWFEHGSRLYWANISAEAKEKASTELYRAEDGKPDNERLTDKQIEEEAFYKASTITELVNCHFQFLYYQANRLTDESWYYCQVTFPHAAKPIKNTFTGSQISGSGEFKKRLLSIAAGSVFTGDNRQLDKILRDQLHGIKTIETIDFIGYCKEHRCY